MMQTKLQFTVGFASLSLPRKQRTQGASLCTLFSRLAFHQDVCFVVILCFLTVQSVVFLLWTAIWIWQTIIPEHCTNRFLLHIMHSNESLKNAYINYYCRAIPSLDVQNFQRQSKHSFLTQPIFTRLWYNLHVCTSKSILNETRACERNNG